MYFRVVSLHTVAAKPSMVEFQFQRTTSPPLMGPWVHLSEWKAMTRGV